MADMLVTASELASFLQKDVDTASATLAIEIATGLVQGAAEQRIVQVIDDTVTLDLDADDRSQWISLPERPVTAVGTVLVGATTVTDFTAQLRRGRLYRAMGWRSATLPVWSAPSTVTVTYSHGYATGDQKLQVARGATFALAAVAYENATGATSEQIDDYAVRYEAAAARLEASPALKTALRRQYGRPAGSALLVSQGR